MSKSASADKKAGFNRLKGLAAAAVMGAGVVGVGAPVSVRAIPLTNSNRFNFSKVYGSVSESATHYVNWQNVGIQSAFSSYSLLWHSYSKSTTSSWVSTSGHWTSSGYWTTSGGYSTTTGGYFTPVSITTCTTPSTTPSCWLTFVGSTWVSGAWTRYPGTNIWITTDTYWTTTNSWTTYSIYPTYLTTTNTAEGEGWNHLGSYPETVTESVPVNFEIGDASYFKAGISESSISAGSLFEGVLGFSVDENTFIAPLGSVSLKKGVISVDPQVNIVEGINADVEYYFSPDAPFVRALYTLTNTTESAIDIELAVKGTLGYGNDTAVVASSDKNTTLNNGDEWVVLGLSEEVFLRGGQPPVIAFGRFGGEAPLVKPTNEATIENGDYLQAYDLSIPANSKKSVMVYMALAASLSDAESTIDDLSENPEVLLEGLSEKEIASIVNYDFADGTEAEVNNKKSSFFGGFDLAFLLAASGALVIRRKKTS